VCSEKPLFETRVRITLTTSMPRTSSELDDWERPDWNFESSKLDIEEPEKTSWDAGIEAAGVGLIMTSFAMTGNREMESSGDYKTVGKLEPFLDNIAFPLQRVNLGRGLNGTMPVRKKFEDGEPHLRRCSVEVESTLTKSYDEDQSSVGEQGKRENSCRSESSCITEGEDCCERRGCGDSDAVDDGLEHGVNQNQYAEPGMMACPTPPPALDHLASTNVSAEDKGPGEEIIKPQGEKMRGEEEPCVDAYGSGKQELRNGQTELCNVEAVLPIYNGEEELCNGEEKFRNGEEELRKVEEELRAHAEGLMNLLGERVEQIMNVLGDRFQQDDGVGWSQKECVSPRVSIPTTSALHTGLGLSGGAPILQVGGAEECHAACDPGGKVQADGIMEAVNGGIRSLDGGVETTGIDGSMKAVDGGMANLNGAIVGVDTALSGIGSENGEGRVDPGGWD
jgi:hypothetical protein